MMESTRIAASVPSDSGNIRWADESPWLQRGEQAPP
jgi:hypothetical protein